MRQGIQHRGSQLFRLPRRLRVVLLLQCARPFQSDRAERRQRGCGEPAHSGSAQSQGAHRPHTQPKNTEPAVPFRSKVVRIQQVGVASLLTTVRDLHRSWHRRSRKRSRDRASNNTTPSKLESLANQRRDQIARIARTIQEQNSPRGLVQPRRCRAVPPPPPRPAAGRGSRVG